MGDIVERLRNFIPGEHEEYVPEVNALAVAEIERLRRRVVVLEMVISQECDGDFCKDDLNRMIVDDIRNRPQSPDFVGAKGSEEANGN